MKLLRSVQPDKTAIASAMLGSSGLSSTWRFFSSTLGLTVTKTSAK
jgi:hypothetical protein